MISHIGLVSVVLFLMLVPVSIQSAAGQSDSLLVLVGYMDDADAPEFEGTLATFEGSLQKAIETAADFDIEVELERRDVSLSSSLQFEHDALQAQADVYIVVEPYGDRMLVRTGFQVPTDLADLSDQWAQQSVLPISAVLAMGVGDDSDLLTNVFVGAVIQESGDMPRARQFYEAALAVLDAAPESDRRFANQIDLYRFISRAIISVDPRDDDNETLSRATELLESARELALTSEAYQHDAETLETLLTMTYLDWGHFVSDETALREATVLLEDAAAAHLTDESFDVYVAIQSRLGNTYLNLQQMSGHADDLYRAEFSFLAALDVIGEGANPTYESALQLELANVYKLVAHSSQRREDFQRVVAHLEAAMRSAIRDNQAQLYGLAASNLGGTYMDLAQTSVNPLAEFNAARLAYEDAQEYLTFEGSPEVWLTNRFQLAMISLNLAQITNSTVPLRQAVSNLDELVPLVAGRRNTSIFVNVHLLRGSIYVEISESAGNSSAEQGERLGYLHEALESSVTIAALSPTRYVSRVIALGYANLRATYSQLAQLPQNLDRSEQFLNLSISSSLSALRFYGRDAYPFDYFEELGKLRTLYAGIGDRRAMCAVGAEMIDVFRQYGIDVPGVSNAQEFLEGMEAEQRANCRGLS